jgi:hypothetical protein
MYIDEGTINLFKNKQNEEIGIKIFSQKYNNNEN